MRIFVTGGSGFLGSRMIRTLVAQEHQVFALARSTSSAERVRTLGATPVTGDLERPEHLSLPEIEAVVHAAAYFRFAGPRSPYFPANVEGTRALLRAAQDAGAATFIYVSAGAVVMDDRGSSIRDADERAPTFPNSFSGYIASKAQGEAAVLAANKPGFRTIAIRPPAIWGPGDPFSRALPHAIGSGRFAFIARGDYPFAICHVDNVIEAVQCALERGSWRTCLFCQGSRGDDVSRLHCHARGFARIVHQRAEIDFLSACVHRRAVDGARRVHQVLQRRPAFVAYNGADDRAGIYRERSGRAP